MHERLKERYRPPKMLINETSMILRRSNSRRSTVFLANNSKLLAVRSLATALKILQSDRLLGMINMWRRQ